MVILSLATVCTVKTLRQHEGVPSEVLRGVEGTPTLHSTFHPLTSTWGAPETARHLAVISLFSPGSSEM
jgi:hypothetical protein